MFVTSQGSAYGRFRRALESGSPVVALAAAHDLHQLSLTDSLELCLVLRGDPARYSRAVARWHSRYAAENRSVSGPESAAVLALLLAIAGPRPEPAARALAELLGETGYSQASQVLMRWANTQP
jgi:hypothetical protein